MRALVERRFDGDAPLLELAALLVEPFLCCLQRPVACIEPRPHACGFRFGVAQVALLLADGDVPLAHGELARGDARLRLLLPRRECGALALELALALGDLRDLLRNLRGSLRTAGSTASTRDSAGPESSGTRAYSATISV